MKRLTYHEMTLLPTFEDRYEYLRLGGGVGKRTFGWERIFNQTFYHSREWKRARRDAIVRDNGCDLAMPDREIFDKIIIHHLNPITLEQIEEGHPDIFDLNNLVCVSHNTHNAIHYGDAKLLVPSAFVERKPGDTDITGGKTDGTQHYRLRQEEQEERIRDSEDPADRRGTYCRSQRGNGRGAGHYDSWQRGGSPW